VHAIPQYSFWKMSLMNGHAACMLWLLTSCRSDSKAVLAGLLHCPANCLACLCLYTPPFAMLRCQVMEDSTAKRAAAAAQAAAIPMQSCGEASKPDTGKAPAAQVRCPPRRWSCQLPHTQLD
jgi:hypothetical protein